MSTNPTPALLEGAPVHSEITQHMAEAAALRGLYEALAEFCRVRASVMAATNSTAEAGYDEELPAAA